MARVEVYGGSVQDGRLVNLQVQLGRLPKRTIDRDTAIAWMKDMHSFVPVVGGRDLPALQLVEIADDEENLSHFIRTDNEAVGADTLPDLPNA